MRVFVTGATGFVGSHLIEALLARGDDVAALVRSPAKADRLFIERRPEYVPGDLNDVDALRRGADGADVVLHVAGVTSARDAAEFREINEYGTRRVVEASIASAPDLRRLLYVSSLSAAGPTGRGAVLTEDAAPRPISAYGRTKLAGERIVEASGLPFTIVRPPAVYGPRDVEMRRLFSFGARGIAPVFADGGQELNFVHVDDLVRGMLAAIERGPGGRRYYVCHPEVLTAEQFVREVCRAVSEVRTGTARDPRMVLRVPGWAARAGLTLNGVLMRALGGRSVLSADKVAELLAPAWACSPAALERDTGWRAEVSAAIGLRRTAEWYRQNGWV